MARRPWRWEGRLDPESRTGSLRRGRRSTVLEERTAGGGAGLLPAQALVPPHTHTGACEPPDTGLGALRAAISKEVRDADIHPTPVVLHEPLAFG